MTKSKEQEGYLPFTLPSEVVKAINDEMARIKQMNEERLAQIDNALGGLAAMYQSLKDAPMITIDELEAQHDRFTVKGDVITGRFIDGRWFQGDKDSITIEARPGRKFVP